MSDQVHETWWVLRPLPRRLRVALWIGGTLVGVWWLVSYGWPVTRQLFTEGAPPPQVRDFAIYGLGLAVVGFFALIAGGVWVFLKLQSEFKKLHEEDSKR
ncbi:MAG: hypothetical protein K8S98_00840 [Planctomycetes bacterium]|nr:hypothetical protein [Planctomycetota bacterium]